MTAVYKKFWRVFLKAILAVIILFCLLLLAGAIYLQTESGQQQARHLLEGQIASSLGCDVTMEGIQLTFPLGIAVGHLVLADEAGIWLEASDVKMGVVPSLNLARKISVSHVNAETLYFHKVPQLKKSEETAKKSITATTSPDVFVHNIGIRAVTLGEPVTGLEKPITMQVKGRIIWYGEEERLAFKVDGIANDALLPQLQQAVLKTEGYYSLKKDKVALENISLVSPDHVTFKSKLALNLANKKISGKAEVSLPKLEQWSPLLKGNTAGDISLSGTLTAPSVQATFQSQAIQVEDKTIPDAKWNITAEQAGNQWKGTLSLDAPKEKIAASTHYLVDKSSLYINALNAKYETCSAQADMVMSLASFLVSGTSSGQCADLAALKAWVPQIHGGAANYHVTLSHAGGNQSIAAELTATELMTDAGSVRHAQMQTSLHGANHFLPETITVKAEGAMVSGVNMKTVELTAKPESKQSWRIDSKMQGTSPVDFSLRGGGRAEMHSSDDWSIAIAMLEGVVDKHNIALKKQVDIALNAGTTQWKAPLLSIDNGHISSQGKIQPDKVGIAATVDNLSLAEWGATMPDALQNSTLSGTLDISGTPAVPQLSLDATISHVQLSEQTPFVNVPVKADYKNKVMHVTSHIEQDKLANADVDMRVPAALSISPFVLELQKNSPLSGNVALDFSINGLSELLLPPGHSAKGSVAGKLAIGGVLEKPDITGAMHIADGSYANLPIGLTLREISGTLQAKGNTLQLQDFVAKDKKGHALTGGGKLEWGANGAFAFDMALNAKDVALLNHPNVQGSVSGDVTVKGDQDKASITGNLEPRPIEIRVPERFASETPQLNVVATIPPEEKKPEIAYPIALNISVKSADQIFIRGQGVDAEIGGALQITGNASHPEIKGKLSTKRGHYEEFGRQFIIKEASLTFEGDMPPSPYLDIVASTMAGDIEIRPTLSGPLMEPKLSIASNPSLPEDEALSHLLFGKDAGKISPVQAAQLANSLLKLSGKGGGGFDPMGKARELLGVDELKLESASDDPKDTTVGVGKYLHDDVYLEIEKGSQTGTGKATIEVGVTPSISVESSAGETGQSSVGVNWKHDY